MLAYLIFTFTQIHGFYISFYEAVMFDEPVKSLFSHHREIFLLQ